MTNVGERTQKKPGAGIMLSGLIVAAVGLVLVVLVFSSGGAPTIFVWAVLLVGIVLAVIGFAMRILAAVERR